MLFCYKYMKKISEKTENWIRILFSDKWEYFSLIYAKKLTSGSVMKIVIIWDMKEYQQTFCILLHSNSLTQFAL